jgi:hypothetical protein
MGHKWSFEGQVNPSFLLFAHRHTSPRLLAQPTADRSDRRAIASTVDKAAQEDLGHPAKSLLDADHPRVLRESGGDDDGGGDGRLTPHVRNAHEVGRDKHGDRDNPP